MDKKQRISTIATFSVVLIFAFLAVAYALVKGPGEIYTSLDEGTCSSDDLACIEAQAQAAVSNEVVGYYKPENIANYVNVPGVSGKLFGFNKGNSLGVSSFLPSGVTTLALLSTPIATGGGSGSGSSGDKQVQQLSICSEGLIECNGDCISTEEKCEDNGDAVLISRCDEGFKSCNNDCIPEEEACSEGCNPQIEICEEELSIDDQAQAVPEPATMLLFGAGLAGAALRRKFQA